MNLTTTITLLLGLVFQLAQVLPGAAVTTPCCSHAESCDCCDTATPCPCAENREPDHPPSPTPVNNAALLKITAMNAAETTIPANALRKNTPPATSAVFSQTAPLLGYTGVRLAVAFCSFVI